MSEKIHDPIYEDLYLYFIHKKRFKVKCTIHVFII